MASFINQIALFLGIHGKGRTSTSPGEEEHDSKKQNLVFPIHHRIDRRGPGALPEEAKQRFDRESRDRHHDGAPALHYSRVADPGHFKMP